MRSSSLRSEFQIAECKLQNYYLPPFAIYILHFAICNLRFAIPKGVPSELYPHRKEVCDGDKNQAIGRVRRL